MNKYETALRRNVLLDFLELFPKELWDSEMLLKNPNITSEYVRDNARRWDFSKYLWHRGVGSTYKSIRRNGTRDIPKTIVEALEAPHPRKWRYHIVLDMPDITLAEVLASPWHRWNFARLSQIMKVSMADVLANPQLPWDFVGLVQNPHITFAELDATLIAGVTWHNCSMKTGLTLEDILRATPRRIFFHIPCLSANPTVITRDILDELAELASLAESAKPAEPGDMPIPSKLKALRRSKNLVTNSVLSGRWRPLDCLYLSSNPNLRARDIEANPCRWEGDRWNPLSFTANPGITIEDMRRHPNIYWHHERVFTNPNFTPEDIDFCTGPLDFSAMSKNKFNKDPTVREHLMRLAAEEEVRIAELLVWFIPDICRVVLAY